ncbi:MAG: anti-sigma factor antagonist [Tepidisphaeraceae bacterium]|jgi:anti-sigma B factor antagonist
MPDARGKDDLVSTPQIHGDAVIAAVRGEIDLHNSPELRSALLGVLGKNRPKKLIVNLAQVPYVDSSAIAVLVETLQKMRRGGGRVVLVAVQPRVKGLLEIARLDSIFVLAASDDEALAK